MGGDILRVILNREKYEVTVTYSYKDLVVSKTVTYTAVRWQPTATSMSERVAYATAEATRLCVEEVLLHYT